MSTANRIMIGACPVCGKMDRILKNKLTEEGKVNYFIECNECNFSIEDDDLLLLVEEWNYNERIKREIYRTCL